MRSVDIDTANRLREETSLEVSQLKAIQAQATGSALKMVTKKLKKLNNYELQLIAAIEKLEAEQNEHSGGN